MIAGPPPRALLAAVLVVTLGGCAAVPPGAGFPDVEKLAADRGLPRLRWNQGTADDRAADQAMRELLARPLTADGAVQMALLKNPELQATYEDLAVAQADLVQAGLLRNPVFDGEFRLHEGSGDLAFEGSLVVSFIDLFLVPLRKRAAEAEFEAAKQRVTGEVLDLAGRARAAFYTTQADRQILEMRRVVVSALAASREVAERLRKAGNITELALAAERAQHEQAKADLALAEAEYLSARERLTALMGLWGRDTQWTLADRLPDPPDQELPLEDAEKRAVARSLTLGVQRQQIIASAQRLGLSRPLATLLDGEIGASAEHSAEEGWAIGPAITIPVPLFDQGEARVAKAQAELRRARQLYAARAIETRAEARAAAVRLRAAWAQVEQYRTTLLPLRQRVVEQTQLQYNAMQVGVFELLRARQEQVEAGARYVRALREYWLARSDLEQITNGWLPRGAGSFGVRQAGGSGDENPRGGGGGGGAAGGGGH